MLPACELDFGNRPVELRGTLEAAPVVDEEGVAGSFGVKAGDLTLSGGKLLAPGDSAKSGGRINVELSGAFLLTGADAQIDVAGHAGGGTVDVQAASIAIERGSIVANGGRGEECGGAGAISLAASGALRIDGDISATTSSGAACDGGSVSLSGATVVISKQIDVSGGGTGGNGEVISIAADSGDLVLESTGSLAAKGLGTHLGEGVSGSEIALKADGGDIVIAGSIEATGSGPNGSGGKLEVTAAGEISITRAIAVDGNGSESSGGEVAAEATHGISVEANVTATGGRDAMGGTVGLTSSGAVTIASGATLDVSGGYGGGITIVPAYTSWKALRRLIVAGTLRARGSGADTGGSIDLTACDITVTGTIDAGSGSAGSAGLIALTGGHLAIARTGTLLARPCPGSEPCIVLSVAAGAPSIDPGARIDPPPAIQVDPSLDLCCGNDVVDVDLGEECDQGDDGDALKSCDGCTKACKLEPPDPCADDGNPCTGTTCIPEIGCEPLTGNACPDDSDLCTDDVCSAGRCTHPSPCRDPGQDPCRIGTCDPATGCHFENLADGIGCTVNGCASTCREGACVNPCDDGSPCTVDSCGGFTGCQSFEQPGLCPSCGTADSPLPAGTPCADGNQCTHPDTCDGAGSCVPGPVCEDGNPCTNNSDACVSPATSCWVAFENLCPLSCVGSPDGTPCSDGDPCTTGTCQGGACISTVVTCGAGEVCDGVWTRIPLFCCVRDPAPDTCADDGNPCTADYCDAGGGCVHEPLSGTPCDSDADQCTQDVCEAGTCTHPPRGCDDGNPCTADSCDPAQGCLHEPLSETQCADDGDLCTDDVCDDGTCRHPPIDCNDGDACTSDSCDPAGGCGHDPIDCDDNNPCTADSCDPASGCVHTPSCQLDHFQCYRATTTPGTASFEPILGLPLEDELGATSVDVKKPATLCLPASKRGEDPTAPSHEDHLAGYRIKTAAGAPPFSRQAGLRVVNQLGTLSLDLAARDRLLLPSAKSLTSPPGQPGLPNPDHFECYRAKVAKGTPGFQPISGVALEDQLGSASVNIKKPTRLCNPANKNGEDPGAPGHPEHLLCYAIARSPGSPKFVKRSPVYVSNQFGQQTLDLPAVRELCVPSTIEAP